MNPEVKMFFVHFVVKLLKNEKLRGSFFWSTFLQDILVFFGRDETPACEDQKVRGMKSLNRLRHPTQKVSDSLEDQLHLSRSLDHSGNPSGNSTPLPRGRSESPETDKDSFTTGGPQGSWRYFTQFCYEERGKNMKLWVGGLGLWSAHLAVSIHITISSISSLHGITKMLDETSLNEPRAQDVLRCKIT